MHQETFQRNPWSFLKGSWISYSHARTWSRWRSVYQMGWSCRQRLLSLHDRSRIFSIQTELVDYSQQVWKNWTIEKAFWLQPSVVYTKPFTPRILRTTNQVDALPEVPAKATVIEFFLHMVAMEWILVVFIIQRKSITEDACSVFGKNLRRTAFTNLLFSMLLQLDRLKLTAVCCNRRWVRRQHLKRPVFAVWISTRNYKEFTYRWKVNTREHWRRLN